MATPNRCGEGDNDKLDPGLPTNSSNDERLNEVDDNFEEYLKVVLRIWNRIEAEKGNTSPQDNFDRLFDEP